MGTKAIDIPAGEQNYAIEDGLVLPADVTLLSVYPHAHYLGKEMRAEAALPDGSTKRLLLIRRWDFHWQQDYRYVAPVPLPRGTRLTMRYTYDNSETNEANPSRPPRPVTWGPQSSDEMGNLGLQLLASPADRALLSGPSPSVKHATTCAAPRFASSTHPAILLSASALGSSYLEVGRVADAIAAARDCRASAARRRAGAQLSGRRTPGGRPHGGRHRAVAGSRQAGAARCAPAVQPRQGARDWRTCASRRRSVRAGDRSRSGISRSRTRSSGSCSSLTGVFARRFRICSVRSTSLRIRRRRTATSGVRSPRPDASATQPRISGGRWSSTPPTLRRARTSPGCRAAETPSTFLR